jgi:hypothetical protein
MCLACHLSQVVQLPGRAHIQQLQLYHDIQRLRVRQIHRCVMPSLGPAARASWVVTYLLHELADGILPSPCLLRVMLHSQWIVLTCAAGHALTPLVVCCRGPYIQPDAEQSLLQFKHRDEQGTPCSHHSTATLRYSHVHSACNHHGMHCAVHAHIPNPDVQPSASLTTAQLAIS